MMNFENCNSNARTTTNNQDALANRTDEQCRHKKKDGSQCHAKPRHGSHYCFFHDPDSTKEREAARINGGRERSRKAAVLPADTPSAPLTSAAEITALMADTINQVRRGEVAPQVSNAVGYLAGILLKAKQQEELEQRLVRVESILAAKWSNPNAVTPITLEPQSFEFTKTNPEVHA